MRVNHTNFPNTDLDLKIYFRPTFSEYINLDDLKYDLDYDFEFRESI